MEIENLHEKERQAGTHETMFIWNKFSSFFLLGYLVVVVVVGEA